MNDAAEGVSASFFSRAIAFLVDAFLCLVIVMTILMTWFIIGFEMSPVFSFSDLFVIIITLAGVWLYFSLQESSARQATWGKRLMKLRVVDEKGARISFLRASCRTLGRYASDLFLGFGYLMALFTKRKQTLHDKIARTLVIKCP